MNPRWPIYIVSKGRYENPLTSDHLTRLKVPHYVIVEELELESYRKALGKFATPLVLDPSFQRDYDTCDDLGDSKSKGPGPARNFAWTHSIVNLDARWHWVMDDNIDGFYRLNKNLKTPVATATIFRCMEDFADRYANVAMAGPQYFMFASRKCKMPPFILNTRIYSCNLIRNDIPYRWRGRYNEDTDLSLRALKDGWCTVLFYAFIIYKLTTMSVKGGNTAELYKGDGRLKMAESLCAQHPDVAKITRKWNRWQHQVDYRPFKKNKLILKEGVRIPEGVNNYGIVLEVDPA